MQQNQQNPKTKSNKPILSCATLSDIIHGRPQNGVKCKQV